MMKSSPPSHQHRLGDEEHQDGGDRPDGGKQLHHLLAAVRIIGDGAQDGQEKDLQDRPKEKCSTGRMNPGRWECPPGAPSHPG